MGAWLHGYRALFTFPLLVVLSALSLCSQDLARSQLWLCWRCGFPSPLPLDPLLWCPGSPLFGYSPPLPGPLLWALAFLCRDLCDLVILEIPEVFARSVGGLGLVVLCLVGLGLLGWG